MSFYQTKTRIHWTNFSKWKFLEEGSWNLCYQSQPHHQILRPKIHVCIISWFKSFNPMPYAFFGFFIKCACPLLISKTTKNAKIKLIFLHNYVKWYTTGARWFQDILKLCTLGIQDGQYNIPVDTQNVNWTYIRSSEDILDVFWTSYVRSMYVLCLRGFLSKVKFDKFYWS